MSEPLYAIGQKVAVCTPALTVILPHTTVTERRFWAGGVFFDILSQTDKAVTPAWWYRVSDQHDPSHEFAEWCLRPLHDDDYADPAHTSEPTGERA